MIFKFRVFNESYLTKLEIKSSSQIRNYQIKFLSFWNKSLQFLQKWTGQINVKTFKKKSGNNWIKIIKISRAMKIVPLDKEGKYLIENFLEMIPHYETSRRLYTVLHHKAMQTGNPKFSQTKKVSKKIKRLFLDIYKRICLKLSKKTAQKIFLSPEMEQKIAIVIRHYNYLTTKDIFIRICYRYVGNKELGQVTESEEMQFYQEVNKKLYRDGNLKKQMVDFQRDEWQDDDEQDEKRVSLFANGQFQEEDEEDEQKDAKKKDKNWDKQIQKQIKKVEEQIVLAKKERLQEQKIQQQEYEKKQEPRRSKRKSQHTKHQETHAQKSQDGEEQSGIEENSQSQFKDKKDRLIQEEKDEKTNRVKKQEQKNDQVKKQQVKTPKNEIKTEKRKILKTKGPKDTTPVELKDDKDIWTLPTYKSLCVQFLKQENCLINLASEFSKKHKIVPIISVKELSQKLVEILIHGFKIFVKISKQDFKRKFQISEISDCEEKYLQKFFKSSKGSPIRKKLIRIYLKNNDQDFELKQKEAYEIFLHMKEGLISLIEKQDENLCDQDELLQLLQAGKLTIEQQVATGKQKSKEGKQKKKGNELDPLKRTNVNTQDKEERVTFTAGKKLKK